jgi:SET domain-containing protein
MIEVTKIPNKGRGIIATQDIPQGTLIEASPAITFPLKQRLNINETELFKYYFVQPSEYGKSQTVNGYLVFGLVSLLNHAEQPNTRINWIEDQVGLWSHLIAEKDIKAGEEVTMSYANIDEYANANKFV